MSFGVEFGPRHRLGAIRRRGRWLPRSRRLAPGLACSLVLHVVTGLLFVRLAGSAPGGSLEVFTVDPIVDASWSGEENKSTRRSHAAARRALRPPRPAPQTPPSGPTAPPSVAAAAGPAEAKPEPTSAAVSPSNAVGQTVPGAGKPDETNLTAARTLVDVPTLLPSPVEPPPAPASPAVVAAPQPSPPPPVVALDVGLSPVRTEPIKTELVRSEPAKSETPPSRPEPPPAERAGPAAERSLTTAERPSPAPERQTATPEHMAIPEDQAATPQRQVTTPDPPLRAPEKQPEAAEQPTPGPERLTPAPQQQVPFTVAGGPAGSALGLGLARLRVHLDGPRSKITDREMETVSGRIVGGTAEGLVVYVNGAPRDVALDGNSFQVPVGLQPGINEIRVVVRDPHGVETEGTTSLQYVPPPVSPRIVLAGPKDGQTLSADDPPFVLVEGHVDDASVSSVSLLVNDRRIVLAVHGGRFRHILPVVESVVRVVAEVAVPGTAPQQTPIVTVRSALPYGSVGVLVMNWPSEAAGVQVEVVASWRARSDRIEAGVAVPVKGVATEGAPPALYYLKNLRPGVYTFTLRYRGAVSANIVSPTLYLPRAGTLVARPLRSMSLEGNANVLLARVLLPQGVFWDQDEWFTGKTESTDTITKFRLPEGVSWSEPKAVVR